jgi:hypothetical protein
MIWSISRLLSRVAYFAPGGYSLRPTLHRWRGVKLGKGVWISQFVYIDELHPEAVTIGDNCTIGLRSSIFAHFYWGPRRAQNGLKPVVIGQDTFIGPHCVILPGVKIGAGCVIKAGTVLTRNVPDRTFWGPPDGGPLAEVTVPLTPAYSYEEFLRGLRPFRPRLNGASATLDRARTVTPSDPI